MTRDVILKPGDFFSIPRSIGASKTLTLAAKLVYGILLDHLGQNDKAWPGERLIATKLGVHRSTVVTAVAQLKGGGWLTVEARDGKSNLYYLSVPPAGAQTFERSSNNTDTKPPAAQILEHPPAQGFEQSENPTPTCREMRHKLLNGTTALATQGESTTPLAASPPAVAVAPARVAVPLFSEDSGTSDIPKASPATPAQPKVAKAIKHPVPATALPLPAQGTAGEGEAIKGPTAATQAQMLEFERVIAERKAELAIGAKPDAGAVEPLQSDDGEADFDEGVEDENLWDGAFEPADDEDLQEVDAEADPLAV